LVFWGSWWSELCVVYCDCCCSVVCLEWWWVCVLFVFCFVVCAWCLCYVCFVRWLRGRIMLWLLRCLFWLSDWLRKLFIWFFSSLGWGGKWWFISVLRLLFFILLRVVSVIVEEVVSWRGECCCWFWIWLLAGYWGFWCGSVVGWDLYLNYCFFWWVWRWECFWFCELWLWFVFYCCFLLVGWVSIGRWLFWFLVGSLSWCWFWWLWGCWYWVLFIVVVLWGCLIRVLMGRCVVWVE